MTLWITWRFYIQKIETLQKPKQFAIRFNIQKPGTFRYAIFHWIFEICGGGGTFIHLKNNALVVTFLYWKKIHFALRFSIQRDLHYSLYINLEQWTDKKLTCPRKYLAKGSKSPLPGSEKSPWKNSVRGVKSHPRFSHSADQGKITKQVLPQRNFLVI